MTYSSQWPKAIIHVDGDAFFASCEQAIHPEYRGKPVITGKERGIVAAASYEAKALGINRGTALWDVKKICPEAIILPSDYETYSLFSERMFSILRRFTSEVEEYGIDEGFAELTGLEPTLGFSYEQIALRIKETIERELAISVSLGLSVSKVLAKLGSKHNKPSGFVVISADNIRPYLEATAAKKIWGIGPSTTAYCQTLGINTALEFADQSEETVERRFTKPLVELWHELNGRSVLPLATAAKISYDSIGKTRTFTPPSANPAYVFAQLLKNIENACIKTRRYRLATTGLVVYLKEQSFRYHGIETKLTRATSYPEDLIPIAKTTFEKIFRSRTLYRATGVIFTGLIPQNQTQLSLFEGPTELQKMERIYNSIDELSAKFGKHTVHLGGSHAAHGTPQHVRDRGDVPERKQSRLKGENARQHLTIPLLLNQV